MEVARLRAPDAYQKAIDEIMLCLAQQPLHRLQKLPGSSASDPFLYDDSFLHDQVSPLDAAGTWRRDRAQTRRRTWSRATGRAAQAGAGDHVGRRRPPDE